MQTVDLMGLTPNEIAFLDYLNGLPQANNLPDYWKFSYGINSKKEADKFLKLGLILYVEDLKNALMRKYIPDLKEILKKYNLSTTGKKEILSERILENINTDTLKTLLDETRFFRLTSKGKMLIQNYYLFIINLKEHYFFDDASMITIYKQYPNENTNNLIILLLIQDINTLKSQYKWGQLQTRIYQLAKHYFKIDNYSEALKYYIYNLKLILLNFSDDNYLQELSSICFSEQFIKELKSIIFINQFTNDKLQNIINDEKISQDIPFKLFDNSECFHVLYDLINDKEFNINNYSLRKPSKNSTLYKYYGFEESNYDLAFKKLNKDNNISIISKIMNLLKNR